MTLKDVTIGVKLELEVMYPDGNNPVKMVSQLNDIEDETTALIAIPMTGGLAHTLVNGTMLNAFFIVKRDMYRMELYTFPAVVVGKIWGDKVPLLRIRLTGELKKMQRREYYRTECSLEIRYSLLIYSEEKQEKATEYKKTITKNISGGGVCILLQEEIPVRSMLKCILSLGGKRIPFKGKVVRVSPYGLQGIYNYEAGISFTDIKDSNREDIIKFIFREQRRMLKKGLI